MTTDMARTPQQSYWEEHSKTLKRIRNDLTENGERSPRRHKEQFQPLSDSHPLLQGNQRSSNSPQVHQSPRQTNGTTRTPPVPRGRHSRTPPSRLPRMSTPPDHRHEAKVRGVHFDVLPNVRNQPNGYENGYDSWGENADSDSDGDYNNPYPSYPYPVVMYPMVLPHHHPQRRKPKSKKKHVRYRNTPQVMNSRENTIHEPQQIHDYYSTYSYDDPDRYPYDTYDGGGTTDSPHFSYIAPSHEYDPFDPRMNPVLARYQVPLQRRERDYSPVAVRRMSLDTILSTSESDQESEYDPCASPIFNRYPTPDMVPTMLECLKYMDDNALFSRILSEEVIQDSLLDLLIPEVIEEVIAEEDNKRGPRKESPPLSYTPDKSYFVDNNSLEAWLTEVIDEVVKDGSRTVVQNVMVDMVDSHLEKAAVYDIAVDLVNEHLELTLEDVAVDAFEEVFYESVIEEYIIKPELKEQQQEIVTEVCDNYNNKKRRTDLRQVKRDTGDKLLDGLCLDYILALAARQGKIWTEGEHANKLFDNMILTLLLEQFIDIGYKRRLNVNAKPIRRHHEKMVADVAVDVVLEELCKSLDEDMADLDEYEMGLEDTAAKMKYADLEHVLAGL